MRARGPRWGPDSIGDIGVRGREAPCSRGRCLRVIGASQVQGPGAALGGALLQGLRCRAWLACDVGADEGDEPGEAEQGGDAGLAEGVEDLD